MTVVETKTRSAKGPVRTCVGCAEKDLAAVLVRLVVAPDGEVAVDAAGGTFGRGAHVHPRPDCLVKACKGGLSRAMKANVKAEARALASQMEDALDRRMEGLLLAARRAGALQIGADASCAALGKNAPLVIVATDAGSIREKGPIASAVAEGRAVAWGNKERLGLLLGRDGAPSPRREQTNTEVAIAAVTSEKIAAEMKRVCAGKDAVSSAILSPTPTSSKGKAWSSREAR